MTLAEYLANDPLTCTRLGEVELTGEEPEVEVYWVGALLVVQLTLTLGRYHTTSVTRYEVWPSNGILWYHRPQCINPSVFRLIAYPLENHVKNAAIPSRNSY